MAVVVNALVVASAFATALSFSDGIRQLQDAYDPFRPCKLALPACPVRAGSNCHLLAGPTAGTANALGGVRRR
jgi:hypothetical protein